MTRLSLALLGPMQMLLAGQPVGGITYHKARALLAYLIVEAGRPHHRDALAALLWPELPDDAARHNLRQALANLRTAIGDASATPPFLLITRDSIQLNPASNYDLDVAAFTALLTSCATHPHRSRARCRSCTARMEQAITLYRGDFLAEFNVGDSAPFEEWQLRHREHLHQQALGALAHLADYRERRGDDEHARRYARRQIALEPWREEAHRQLMRLLARGGQRSAALAQYATCRRILARDLGVEPEAETTALYEQIRDTASSELPTPKLRAQNVQNFPAQTTLLIGRETELSELGSMLENPACRLITIVGPGGMGKTRLALAAAAEQAEAFAAGAAFVPLQAISATAFVAPAILAALAVALQGQRDPRDQLLEYLRKKELLLVLDNFEQLLTPDQSENGGGAALLTDIVHYASGVTLVVTSRERLAMPGEWLFDLSGLSYPTGETIDGSEDYSAVQLFIQRARQVRRQFALADGDMRAVARICRLVEGLPLAIELAAAALRTRSTSAIAAAIERNLSALAIELRAVPERHRSIRATFEHSWRLLSDDERQVFPRLSVFRGGFEEQAATEVAQASPQLLAALLDKSLLRWDGAARYDMHELVRQYAGEKLEQAEEVEAVLRRHAHYYRTLGTWDFRDRGDQNLTIAQAAQLDAEYDNLWSALLWSQSRAGDAETALQLTGKLYSPWWDRGMLREATAALERSLDHPLGVGRTLTQAVARFQLAGFLEKTGNYAGALIQYEQASHLAREIGDTYWYTKALWGQGQVAREQGDSATAWLRLSESLALCRELGDSNGIVVTLNTMAEVAILDEDPVRAEALLAESRVLEQPKHANPGMVGWTLNHLGHAAQLRGDYQRATQLHRESLECFQSLGIQFEVWAYQSLGETALGLGYLDEAGRWLAQGLTVSQMLGDQAIMAWCLAGLGSAAALDEEPARAAWLWGAAEQLRETIGCRPAPAACATYERAMAIARAQLEEAPFVAAWAEGRAMTLEQAIAYALEGSDADSVSSIGTAASQ